MKSGLTNQITQTDGLDQTNLSKKRLFHEDSNSQSSKLSANHYAIPQGKENIQFCRQSRGSICELIDDFNECYDNKYIDQTYRDRLRNDAYHLIKVLNGYIASIKRQKSKLNQ
jgi:hypothetical protein